MSNDAFHERSNQAPPPSVSVQDNIKSSMPTISEECFLESPTTSTTVRNALRASSPADDALSSALPQLTIRRRTSRLHQWIADQQSSHGDSSPECGSPVTPNESSARNPTCHPYLAYPGMSLPTFQQSNDSRTTESFVVVEEDELDGPPSGKQSYDNVFLSPPVTSSSSRSSPALNASSSRPSSGRFHAPASLRNLHLTLSPSRRVSASSHNPPSPSAPRHPIFQRHSTSNTHAHSPSIGSMASIPASAPDGPSTPRSSRSYGTWRFKRPSVLGAFNASSRVSTPADESADEAPPPRPSFSSSRTFSSGTTGTSTDLSTPQKGSAGSMGTPPISRHKAGSPSLWSLPSDASHLHDPPGSEMLVSSKPASIRIPFALKPHGSNMPPLRHVPSVLSSRDKRKKKLVISGIGMHDQRRYEGIKKWCESFGEINQISRMPNGDLHVDFRRSEVADTVCRVHATVQIAGVGSVALSWYNGRRP
ncbi:hypothetical protein EVG20_g222 [Dentipellis fragilis]|uniref:RRM domain-containing protein n=1 Tax=Dentipellis fragilis TaxID=205917 RepID=A0A4Y9ZDY5_9AGAM|nr:hypothetical protein EVG20_g222 [Dentipellis fragilis]